MAAAQKPSICRMVLYRDITGTFPAVIVKVNPGQPEVAEPPTPAIPETINLKVFIDSEIDLWRTGVLQGEVDEGGHITQMNRWVWPPKV